MRTVGKRLYQKKSKILCSIRSDDSVIRFFYADARILLHLQRHMPTLHVRLLVPKNLKLDMFDVFTFATTIQHNLTPHATDGFRH